MQNIVSNSLAANRNAPAYPIYSDDASIWHHMSDALHQSVYRVLTLLIAVLPGILAFFVAHMQGKYYFEIMLPGGLVGLIVGYATQKHGSPGLRPSARA